MIVTSGGPPPTMTAWRRSARAAVAPSMAALQIASSNRDSRSDTPSSDTSSSGTSSSDAGPSDAASSDRALAKASISTSLAIARSPQ